MFLSHSRFTMLLVIVVTALTGSPIVLAEQTVNDIGKASQAITLDLLIGSDNISGIRLAYRPHIYELSHIPLF